MPAPYQIIPEGSLFRPKIETHINDNTFVEDLYDLGGGTITSALFVFSSPKGRDGKVITITGGQEEFMKEYGLGPFSIYGQPLLNAYAAATAATTSAAMIHCLRVTDPEEASYSVVGVIAKYMLDFDDDGEPTLKVHFVTRTSDEPLKNLEDLDRCVKVQSGSDDFGYEEALLFTIAYNGRGTYGQNIRFRITTDAGSDKVNDYKNYNFAIYRNEKVLSLEESFSVSTVEDAVYDGASIFLEDVLNTNSQIVQVSANAAGFEKIFEEYSAMLADDPDMTYTLNDFDVLLGIDKYTKEGIAHYTIEPADTVSVSNGDVAVNLSSSLGVKLLGGDDGRLAADNPDRQTVLNGLYKDAFAGRIDPQIMSRYRYPTTFLFDADYDVDTKMEMVKFMLKKSRQDGMVMLDFGTKIITKASVRAYYNANFKSLIDNRLVTFEPYCMSVVDPYSKKTVTVTSGYWLAASYFEHIAAWNGKHRPMAGNRFGIIDVYGLKPNSIYPIFDDSIDTELMDELADLKLNIAKYNQNQIVVRAMQNTSQGKLSSLTEQNNMLVVLDVKRDAERLVANYEYDFMEQSDIARFNTDLSMITQKYQDQQVRSITGYFDKNQWEAERSILHLYIEMVMKDLVKTVIIEIDVNRSDDTVAV